MTHAVIFEGMTEFVHAIGCPFFRSVAPRALPALFTPWIPILLLDFTGPNSGSGSVIEYRYLEGTSDWQKKRVLT